MPWRRSLKFENNKLLQKYAALTARDQLLLVFGVLLLVLYGGYLVFYQPLERDNQLLQQKLESQRAAYQHLQQISKEVAAIRQQGGGMESSPDASVPPQSPVAVIDNSSQQLNIKPAIKRLLPEGNDKVTLWLENIAFDKLIYWLAILETKHRLQVLQIDVERQGGEGLVNAKVMLGV